MILAVLAMLAWHAGSAARGQGAVEAAVAKAEPSVVAVIVSRSDWYARSRFGAGKEPRGTLGGFEYSENQMDAHIGAFGLSKLEQAERHHALRAKLDLAYSKHVPEAFGSGIVVDARGLILTNYHVVLDATKVYVRLPGGKGSYANIHAADPRSDLAVLKLIDENLALTPIALGKAEDVRRGQQVIAIANPYAAGQVDGQSSVSVGVISNLRRRIPGRPQLKELNANPLYQFGILMQTDARMALGSSGGALVNLQGECIGLTTSLAALAGSDAQGGFAMPMLAPIRKIVEVLKRGEEVDYGFLGVSFEDIPTPGGVGVAVGKATMGSPAAMQAGLNPGDVLVSVGDIQVRDLTDLMLGLGLCFAGEKTTLGIVRDDGGRPEKRDVTLVKYSFLSDKTIASSMGKRPYVGGMRVDYASVVVHASRMPRSIPRGVVVIDVEPGSKADKLKFAKNTTFITHVAGVAVNTPAEFYAVLSRQGGPVQLTIRRDGDGVPESISW